MTHRPLIRRVAGTVAMLSFVARAALAAQTQDVAGQWKLDVDTPQGMMTVALVLTAEGDTVKGSVSSEMGDTAFTGVLSGAEVSFSFDMNGPQGPMNVKTKGTVTGDDIKGEMDYGMGVAPFTGKRSKP